MTGQLVTFHAGLEPSDLIGMEEASKLLSRASMRVLEIGRGERCKLA